MNLINSIAQAIPFVSLVVLVALAVVRTPSPASAGWNQTRRSAALGSGLDVRQWTGPIN